MLLGICALLDQQYDITSYRESGDGRFDMQLMPRKNYLPGILIKIKTSKNSTEDELKQIAKNALEQIDKKSYDRELKKKGCRVVTK